MRCSGSAWLQGLLMAALMPASAAAQTVARSFEELQGLLDRSSIVFVTDTAGRETWGRVADLSASVLTLAVMEKDGERTLTTANQRTFVEDGVTLIVRSDTSGVKGAAIYPASWHKVQALQPDTPITVVFGRGERRSYRLTSVEPERLRLLTASGQSEAMSKSRVTRVLRGGFDDSIGNGVVLGALTGAGAAVAIITIERARCGPTCNEPSNPGAFAVAATALYAGVGAAVGWIIDTVHKGTEVLFPVAPAPGPSVRLAPILSPRRNGVVVSVRF